MPWRRLTHLSAIPTKYTLDRGVQANFSSSFFTFAKLSVAVLAVGGAVSWEALHINPQVPNNPNATHHTKTVPNVAVNPAGNNVAQISNAASHTASTPVTSNKTKPRTATTSSTAPATSSPANTVDGPVIGGMGGGPVTTPTTTTPTSTDTTTSTTPTTTTGGTSTTVLDPVLNTLTTPISVGPVTVQL